MKTIKTKRRKKIRLKLKKTIRGSSIMPRLSVFRSNKNIYAQIIDDVNGNTLTSRQYVGKDIPTYTYGFQLVYLHHPYLHLRSFFWPLVI